MKYTDKYIDDLIKCKKEVHIPPSKDYALDRGHYKKNFVLKSMDESLVFNCFIRLNQKFPENFSVGLIFKPKDEKATIPLLRLNGKHGENREHSHHTYFHIHRATEENIEKGLSSESYISKTGKYSTVEEAVQYFIKIINLKNTDKIKYFPAKPFNLFG